MDTWIYGKNKQYETKFKEFVEGSTPIISGITINNGVNYYTRDPLGKSEVFKDSLTISTRGEYSGTVTYHEGEFGLANNILVMHMPGWNKQQKLYFATLVNNLNYGGYFGYPRKETLKNDCVFLPLDSKGDIDFAFMQTLIKAVEKLVIKDLVVWNEKKLRATKEAIEKS